MLPGQSAFALTLVMWICISSPMSLAADLPQCPPEIMVRQTISQSPAPWKTFNSDERHPYTGVSFSEGPPDRKVTLAPGKQTRGRNGSVLRWSLPPSKEGYWVSCEYAQTSATIASPLPTDIRSCEVGYDNRAVPPMVTHWACGAR